jgi:exodeoxyribonuclease-1
MMGQPTFFWHDYETWGADPRRDRPAQFAGIRTNLDLEVTDDPVMVYCAPSDDVLPVPEACLVTGLTPQKARAEGVNEAAFFDVVHRELAKPGTCGAGYNSLRFDDEVTRFGLYRNFFDPYAREWQHGNSRWDIIDLVRVARALRPEGIVWPRRDDGAPSFRLEELTAANGIAHEGAHDALVDVYATIALARLVRNRQPRLYDYVFEHRGKREAAALLDWRAGTTVLHVSRRIPAELGCISPVVPLVPHPRNRNSVICFDLRHDPDPLFRLDADDLRERLYTPSAELGEGEERVGLKEVHLNKCPVLVPLNTLTPEAAREWQLDMDAARERQVRLAGVGEIRGKLSAIYEADGFGPVTDPDLALYDGFLSDGDRRLAAQVRHASPAGLAEMHPAFDDPRLVQLLFRYRARNWPDSLSGRDMASWRAWCRSHLADGDEGSSITLQAYGERLRSLRDEMAAGDPKAGILDALAEWPGMIGLPAASP